MITIPVALDEKTRVSNVVLQSVAALTISQELYDRVEQLSKQRVESFMNEHGGVGVSLRTLI